MFIEQGVRLALPMASSGYIQESGRLAIGRVIESPEVRRIFLGA